MSSAQPVSGLGSGAAYACGGAFAVGAVVPGLLPAVIVFCVFLYIFDL
jgi:hypothetical protein